MPILDSLLSLVAPHDCLGCGLEGSLLCSNCCIGWLQPLPSRCYICHKLTEAFRVCPGCFHKTSLRAVYVCGQFDEPAKQLIYKLKFGRARAATGIIADYMEQILPADFKGVIVPVPTASTRRRQRGYDQAVLIARLLAQKRGLSFRQLVKRRGQSRQVGHRRHERLRQLQEAFYIPKSTDLSSSRILLVDDVLTTGATLEAAARVVKASGARRVEAIVFAQA